LLAEVESLGFILRAVADSPDAEIDCRETRELEVRPPSADLTLCPSCGRPTATVGRGTCVECWRAKTPDGQPAIRAVAPETESLLGSNDDVPPWQWIAGDVPLWLWLAGGVALVSGLIAVLVRAL
jgi:hypothetical protein